MATDNSLLDKFFLTIKNAYFQDDDFSNFTGRVQKPGELFESLKAGGYVYLPMITMLTLIEMFGSIISDKKGIKNNMDAFISEFMPSYTPHLDILYDLRNTMVHDWEGGQKMALSVKDGASHLEYSGDEFLINVEVFFEDLKDGLEGLEAKVERDNKFATNTLGRLKKKIENSNSKTK